MSHPKHEDQDHASKQAHDEHVLAVPSPARHPSSMMGNVAAQIGPGLLQRKLARRATV